jgi:hypothetical protein
MIEFNPSDHLSKQNGPQGDSLYMSDIVSFLKVKYCTVSAL